MPSIKDLMEMMSATWPVALALLLASCGVLVGDHFQVPYLASLPIWLPGAAFVVALCSGSVLLVAIIRRLAEIVSEPFVIKRRIKAETVHIDGLYDLPDSERYLLAWALANRTQVFSAPYFNAHIKGLLARGYISVTSGSHSPNETPFYIPDHIWAALKEGLSQQDVSKLIGVRPFDRW